MQGWGVEIKMFKKLKKVEIKKSVIKEIDNRKIFKNRNRKMNFDFF